MKIAPSTPTWAKKIEELNHGQKAQLWERLPFSQQTGSRIARIAEDSRVNAYTHKLPASWMTIYELTKLDDDTFGLALENGTINPNMGQYDAAKLTREADNRFVMRVTILLCYGRPHFTNEQWQLHVQWICSLARFISCSCGLCRQ